MCVMYAGRSAKPKLLPDADASIRLDYDYVRDNKKVLEEAAKLNVYPYVVTGALDYELPSYTVWQVIAKDLLAMPYGVLWSLRWMGKQLVMSHAWHCREYPLYSQGKEPKYPRGLGWPQPIFQSRESYPEYPQGIGISGFGVPVHEIGHTLDFMLNGKPPNWADYAPFHRIPGGWFQSIYKKIKWPSPIHNNNASEAFADSFAIYCLQRQPDGWKRLPQDIDPSIKLFWDQLSKTCGWDPSISAVTSVDEATSDYLQMPSRKVQRYMQKAITTLARRRRK